MSSEPREYLIRKGGYYYRPNCSGYTTSKFEAGRYTKAEAEREAAVEPWHMSAIHQDDVVDDPVSSRVRMDTARIEALEAENARLREALAPFAKAADNFDEFKINDDAEWFAYSGIQRATGSVGAITVADLRAARRVREGGKVDG